MSNTPLHAYTVSGARALELAGVFGLRAYSLYHRSTGAGSHMIRLKNPGGWSNHVSMLYAPAFAPADVLLTCPLFEARAKLGVTGIRPDGTWHPQTRTLAAAIAGGDEVEVWQQFEVLPQEEAVAYEWLTRQVGKNYDMPGLVGFLPLTLLRKAAMEHQRKRRYDSEWWCSELEVALSIKRRLRKLQNVQPFQVDPEWSRSSPLQSFAWGTPPNTPHEIDAPAL